MIQKGSHSKTLIKHLLMNFRVYFMELRLKNRLGNLSMQNYTNNIKVYEVDDTRMGTLHST